MYFYFFTHVLLHIEFMRYFMLYILHYSNVFICESLVGFIFFISYVTAPCKDSKGKLCLILYSPYLTNFHQLCCSVSNKKNNWSKGFVVSTHWFQLPKILILLWAFLHMSVSRFIGLIGMGEMQKEGWNVCAFIRNEKLQNELVQGQCTKYRFHSN